MTKTIKNLLGDSAGIDTDLVKNNLHLKDDLFLDENDIEDILNELEDIFGIELDDRDRELTYVIDLIEYVKEVH